MMGSVMKKILIICVILVSFCNRGVGAERFIPLSNGTDTQIYIDLATISLAGSVYQCWNKIVYSDVYRSRNNSQAVYSLVQYEIEPAKRQYRILHYSDYDKSGLVIDQAFNSGWTPIYPQSFMEGLVDFLLLLTRENPEAINKITTSIPKTNKFLYIGVDTMGNEWHINTESISYNQQTRIAKVLINVVLDKVSGKKMMTKRFKSIANIVSKTSYIIQQYYFHLGQNTSSLIQSDWYSDKNVLLKEVEGPRTWSKITSGSILATAQQTLLQLCLN